MTTEQFVEEEEWVKKIDKTFKVWDNTIVQYSDWTQETFDEAGEKIVPDFWTIAMMILAVAIISIVAVTAKSRVVPRF